MSTSVNVFLLVTVPSRSILMSYASQIHRMRMQGRNGRKLQYKKRSMMLYCSFLYEGEVSFWLSRSPCWLKRTLYIYRCCLTIGHRTRRNTRPRTIAPKGISSFSYNSDPIGILHSLKIQDPLPVRGYVLHVFFLLHLCLVVHAILIILALRHPRTIRVLSSSLSFIGAGAVSLSPFFI